MKTATPFHIQNHVKRLRAEADQMSQAELARRVGVSRQTIIAIEQSRYSPALETACRIAATFQVGLDDVFYWEET